MSKDDTKTNEFKAARDRGQLLLGPKSLDALRQIMLRRGSQILIPENEYIEALATAIYEESGLSFEMWT